MAATYEYRTGTDLMREHTQRMATKPSASTLYSRRHQLAKEWGNEAGNLEGRHGGWVYLKGTASPYCQGWGSVWQYKKNQILDWLTAKLTATRTLDELCASGAENHYRPTILPRNWRYVALADAYDERQWERRDSRRAWRGSGK